MPTLSLITGGSQGLGRSLLRELMARPDSQPVLALSRERPAEATEWAKVDLSTYDTIAHARVADAIDSAILKHVAGRMVFVNNAAVVAPISMSMDISMEALQTACRINYLAAASIAALAAAKADANGLRFEILNISSGAALRPIPGWGAYCSTKAAIRAFLDVLALETGARVHHIDPGIMDTAMQREIRASSVHAFPDVGKFIGYADGGRLASPEAVARRIVEDHYHAGEGE